MPSNKFHNGWKSAARLCVFLCMSVAGGVQAQQDPIFVEMQKKGLVQWSAQHRAWLRAGDWPFIEFKQRSISFRDRFYSQGRQIRILAETLNFDAGSLISSGFAAAAQDGIGSGRSGSPGAHAGSIEILAGKLQGLRVSIQGQVGGDGTPGEQLSPGRGANGGDGGPGGDGGNLILRYLDASALDLDGLKKQGLCRHLVACRASLEFWDTPGCRRQLPSLCSPHADCPKATITNGQINWSGGTPGRPRAGGRADQDTCPGPGDPGRVLSAGREGSVEFRQLNAGQYARLIADALPDSAYGRISTAELLFAANHFDSAEKLLIGIVADGGPVAPDVLARARHLVQRLECGKTYYDRPVNWAPVYFDTSDLAMVRPRPLDWVLQELEQRRQSLRAAEDDVKFRDDKLADAARDRQVLERELAQLDLQTLDSKALLEEYEKAIANLREQQAQLDAFASDIEGMIKAAEQSLMEFPALLDTTQDILTSLGQGIGQVGVGIAAIETGNVPLAILSFTGAFGAFGQAVQSGNSLSERLQKFDVTARVRQHIDDLSHRIGLLDQKVREAQAEIDRAFTRKNLAEQRVRRIDQLRSRLNALHAKQKLDEQELEELASIAREIYNGQRMAAAELVDSRRRYGDIVTRQQGGRTPLPLPVGGVSQLFTAQHLTAILNAERQRFDTYSLSPPQTAQRRFLITRAGEGQLPDFFRNIDGALARNGNPDGKNLFATVPLPLSSLRENFPFLDDARIRSIAFRFKSGDAKSVTPPYLDVRHSGAVGYGATGAPYLATPIAQAMLADDPKFRIYSFWYRRLHDAWDWRFRTPARGTIDELEIDIDFELGVVESVPVAAGLALMNDRARAKACIGSTEVGASGHLLF